MQFKIVSIESSIRNQIAGLAELFFVLEQLKGSESNPILDYKPSIIQNLIGLENLNNLQEMENSLNTFQNFLEQFLLYLQVNAPHALNDTGFMPQNGYSRGRLYQNGFRTLLKSLHDFRPNLLSRNLNLDSSHIPVHNNFVNLPFIKKIKIESNFEDKDIISVVNDIIINNTQNDFPVFIQLDFPVGYDVQRLSEFIKGKISNNNKLAFIVFTLDKEDEKFSVINVIHKQECKNKDLQTLLSRHGSSADLYLLSNWLMERAKERGVWTSAYRYFNKETPTTENTLDEGREYFSQIKELTKNSQQTVNLVGLKADKFMSVIIKKCLYNWFTLIDEAKLTTTELFFLKPALIRLQNYLLKLDSNELSDKESREQYLLSMEEIVLLVAITQPKISLKEQVPHVFNPNDNLNLQNPIFFSSGMNALSQLFTVLKNEYGKDFSLVVDRSIYYEIPQMSRDIIGRNVATLSVDDLIQITTGKTVFANEGAWGQKDVFVKNDTLMLDLHPNYPEAEVLNNTSVKDIVKLISSNEKEILNRDKPFTLIIDTSTHNQWDGEMKKLLNNACLKHLIAKNKLRILSFQSLAKYASLGSDKFHGAIITAYHNSQDRSFINEVSKDISGWTNKNPEKWFSILFKDNQEIQNEFIRRVRSNAKFFISATKNHNYFFVRENRDVEPTFVLLDFKKHLKSYEDSSLFISADDYRSLHYAICNYLVRTKIDSSFIQHRSGFGFFESSISDCGETLRLMLGAMETKETLKGLTKLLKRLSDLLVLNEKIINGKESLSKVLDEKTLGLINNLVKQNPEKDLNDNLKNYFISETSANKTGFPFQSIVKDISTEDQLLLRLFWLHFKIKGAGESCCVK